MPSVANRASPQLNAVLLSQECPRPECSKPEGIIRFSLLSDSHHEIYTVLLFLTKGIEDRKVSKPLPAVTPEAS